MEHTNILKVVHTADMLYFTSSDTIRQLNAILEYDHYI